MDRFRLVQRASNGRPLVVMDLLESQEKNIVWLRGTMRLGGRTPQVTYPASTRARDVARGRGRVDTGTTLTATWRVRGVTPRECIARVDRFLAAVDSGRERLLEWRPEGAPASSFMRIIGPGSYNPLYEWIQWVGASDGPGMNIEVTWPIDPTIEGAPWDVNEDFLKPNTNPEGVINHLPNPGMEAGVAGYWSAYQNVITATITDELTVVRSGSRAARLTCTSAAAGQMGAVTGTIVECAPGDTVRTAGYSRAAATVRGTWSIVAWYTLNGVFISSASGGSAPTMNTTTGWTRTTTLEAVAPAEAYRAAVYVVIGSPANGEVHYVDDVVATVNQAMPADALDGDDDGFVWEGQAHKSRTLEAWESDLAEWTVDVGTSVAIVRPGEMSFAGLGAGAAEWRARHTGRNTGPRVNDEVEVVFQMPAVASTRVTATLSASDDGKTYFQAGVDSGSALRIQLVTTGGTVNQSTGFAVTPVAGATYTIRFSREGGVLTAVLFDRDGVTVLATATHILTTAQLLSFRRGGDAGLRVEGTTTSTARINAWRRRPNTWRVPTTLTLPDQFTIPDLPGSQGGPGHRADVYLQPTSQTSQWSFGLLAWTRRCGVENLVWNGDFEKDLAGWATGGAGPDGGTTVAGVATGTFLTRATTTTTKYGQGIGLLTGDGSVASQAASFRVYDRFKRGQLYTLLVALRNRSSALGWPTVTATTVAGGSLPSQQWFYKVAALNASGESLPSPEVVSVTGGSNFTTRLTWAAVTGATGYRIYRSNTVTGAEDESFDVGAVTTFDDTGALSWTARTPLTTATATLAIPSATVALGFDSTDRSQLTITPTTTQAVYVVEWTPTVDHDFATIAIVGNNAAGVNVQTDIDAVVLFEGSVPPGDADQAVGRGALRPFGKIPARADYRTTRTGAWASTAATDRVALTLAGTGGTAFMEWLVDPFLLESPTDERDPVVEVYLRAQVPLGNTSAFGLRGSISAAPVDVAGARQYASPFFAGGKSLTSFFGGGSFRTYRMGQLQLERDPRSRGRIALRLALSWDSSAGTPTFEPQYLFLAPVDGVASTPTGKALDSTYPVVVPAQGAGQEANVRVITSDLTGLLLGARSWRGTVDSSFGGEPIEFAPGADVLLAAWLNAGVPDNTIVATPVDGDPLGAMIHAAVTPQHTLMVPGR